MFPREIYCASCGTQNRNPNETLLLPPPAKAYPVLGSMFLDYLAIGLLVSIVLWDYLGIFALLLSLLLGLFYRSAARSGGRQSFGQAIFHLQTVSESAGPAGFIPSIVRSGWEFLALPRLVAGRSSAIEKLDGPTLEVTIA